MPSPGRPSIFTPELAETICERLAAGETLRAICRDEGMPDESTVRKWALDPENPFFPQYAHAREIGYHGLADEILEISDDGRNDSYKDDDGRVVIDNEVMGRSRLRVESRKWLLSKCLPKIYGEKQQVEHSGSISIAGNLAVIRAREAKPDAA